MSISTWQAHLSKCTIPSANSRYFGVDIHNWLPFHQGRWKVLRQQQQPADTLQCTRPHFVWSLAYCVCSKFVCIGIGIGRRTRAKIQSEWEWKLLLWIVWTFCYLSIFSIFGCAFCLRLSYWWVCFVHFAILSDRVSYLFEQEPCETKFPEYRENSSTTEVFLPDLLVSLFRLFLFFPFHSSSSEKRFFYFLRKILQ